MKKHCPQRWVPCERGEWSMDVRLQSPRLAFIDRHSPVALQSETVVRCSGRRLAVNLKLGGAVGSWVLDLATKMIGPAPYDPERPDGVAQDVSKLERLFGPSIWPRLADKTVVDFGAGLGFEAVSVALHGAGRVCGLEVRRHDLEAATKRAAACGVAHICEFVNPLAQPDSLDPLWENVDVVYSLDSFEHFADPEAMLQTMYRLLKPGGSLLVSFGPPWLHPFGAHLGHFNRMPWIHFIFSEQTIIRVRSRYCGDGAARLEEIAGGLNRMTLDRFTKLSDRTNFRAASLRFVAIRKLALLTKLAFTREYFTSVVQAELVKRGT